MNAHDQLERQLRASVAQIADRAPQTGHGGVGGDLLPADAGGEHGGDHHEHATLRGGADAAGAHVRRQLLEHRGSATRVASR